jgi:hypothetical protein
MAAKQHSTTTIAGAERLGLLRRAVEEIEQLSAAMERLLQQAREEAELTPELASLIAIGGRLSDLSSAAVIAAWDDEKETLATAYKLVYGSRGRVRSNGQRVEVGHA